MDSKIHIHFFPSDSSRVRIIAFSRALGVGLIFTALPLCMLGFWLVLSGVLRESPVRKLERQQLERENHALREKTGTLRRDANALENNLDSLESARIRAVLATGIEAQETSRSTKHKIRFRFFHTGAAAYRTKSESLARDLKSIRETALFFDSSLFVLSRNHELAGLFPTAFPLGPGALVIRPFGLSADPFTGRRGLHAGVDFSQRPGAPVYASGGGRVEEAGQDLLWGYFVRIRHTNRVETFYAHLRQIRVHAGQNILRGQVIGWVGESGAATGPHLHFEMLFLGERVDPLRYLYKTDNSNL